MEISFHKILCPIDFDDSSIAAVETAVAVAELSKGIIYLFHVIPMIIEPTGLPNYVDIYKGEEETARAKLKEIASKYLSNLKHEILINLGSPTGAILGQARKLGADLIVIATHGRRGLKRVVLGSVAEVVVREAPCPVLTARLHAPEKHDDVSHWMTHNPVTVAPDEKLSAVQQKMFSGGFRSVPVVQAGQLAGIVTDRDVRAHTGSLETTQAHQAMSAVVTTVAPETSIREAARLLRERKVGVLPVVDNGVLVGVITTTDVLVALGGESQ